MAAQAGVKSVVLYHYNPADPAAYVAAVKKNFSGPVFAPADLDRYCLHAIDRKVNNNQNVLVPCGHGSTNASGVWIEDRTRSFFVKRVRAGESLQSARPLRLGDGDRDAQADKY